MEIGSKVRKIRLQQGLTLQDVANACKCSKALLSKIENNKVVPALATLSKISKALNVKVSTLMENDPSNGTAVTPSQIDNPDAFISTSKGYSIYAFASQFSDKKMQPLLVRSEKGEVRVHRVSHDGEEFIYVIQGEVQVCVGGEKYQLKENESIYFESVNEHGVVPLSDVAYYLDILYE